MKLETVFKDGRKETFDNVVSFNVTEKQNVSEECHTPKMAQTTPSEGKLFEVNPLGMDRSNFKKPMKDQRKEWTRQIIQEAFAEVDKQPEKYAFPFYTLIPKKNWDGYKTVVELTKYATDLGGMMADWVEQALEWAQRISNGESWKTICNDTDTANWYRMIVWKNGYARLLAVHVMTTMTIRRQTLTTTITLLTTGSTLLCRWLCLRKSNTVHCYPFLRRQNPKLGDILE